MPAKVISSFMARSAAAVTGQSGVLTEKWKHLKPVLPGEVNIISDCAPGSTLCRPVGRSENRGQKNCDFKMEAEVAEELDFKMKLEITPSF
jgi:hypothetical protein